MIIGFQGSNETTNECRIILRLNRVFGLERKYRTSKEVDTSVRVALQVTVSFNFNSSVINHCA
jgi:hypothetical protein